MPEDRDVAGIAAELGDVIAHPLEGQDQIELADIAGIDEIGRAELGEVEVSKRVQAMIDGDDDDVALAGETLAVGFDFVAGAARIGAAVEPHHDRALAVVAEARGPDIEVQAVFADRPPPPRLRRNGGPNSIASRTPVHGSGATGGRKRRRLVSAP